ncbi:RGH3 splicing factor [Striga asiatica]|uniref:RGH3 splicing factor n=1 Tax=Striga asiatica TaxID=4170 RepID=A0A5A7P9I6_STRAF|nr:RGH3 splicing factor [Striga asiatica]
MTVRFSEHCSKRKIIPQTPDTVPMTEQLITTGEMEDDEVAEANNNDTNTNTAVARCKVAGRKERRKAAKKEKRKKKRKELAEKARQEEEARLNDPEEQLWLLAEEEKEKARVERERREFEERERKILEEWERKRAEDRRAEDERGMRAEKERQFNGNQIGHENDEEENGWEYVEEGPPEIIWQGNEIIVKKKRVRVKRKDTDHQIAKEDPNRPTSNPLPPQSEVFADYKNTSVLSAQQLLENVAQETPNFGTEQDKSHCPFHLKTGACRFGSRCSRIHFYPDKSSTLLIKNMYSGPGLAWEQDEGLEYTDEEVERAYEEFYEDVHTEFLKFGEIVNFKVCKNGSSHLRGNVYVHYKTLDSAVLAYQSVNGRYFAGKQVQCEFVGVTRWKVAICGEFMKSKLQTCSRGKTCNFIHCFRNPGGDYEWADWDKPAPKYWLRKMAALFGYPDESGNEKQIEQSPRLFRKSSRTSPDDADRYNSRRSRSREIGHTRSSRNYSEDYSRSSKRQRRLTTADRKHPELPDSSNPKEKQQNSKNGKSGSQNGNFNRVSIHETDFDENMHFDRDKDDYGHRHSSRNTRHKNKVSTFSDDRWSDDDKRESAHTHKKRSLMADGSEESEDNNSSRRGSRRSKHSSSRDRLGRRHGEDENDSRKFGNSCRSNRSSDSKSRSGKDGVKKLECGQSKRKRDYVSDCDTASDVRGRWEPNISD